MSGKTKIGWTERTWNPLTGCSRVTQGCDHCYAFAWHDKMHEQYVRGNGYWSNGKKVSQQYAKPFAEVQLLPTRLNDPLRWKEPAMIFVNSMGDLFHSQVPDDSIRQVFEVMRRAPWHQFQVLTKRAGRLRRLGPKMDWPSNVWMGVSIEQDTLVGRADALRIGAANASLRFISAEPLLGPLPSLDLTNVDWLIVGAESGQGARPMDEAWVREIRDRCVAQGIPRFYKQKTIIDEQGYGRKVELPPLDGVQRAQFPPRRAA